MASGPQTPFREKLLIQIITTDAKGFMKQLAGQDLSQIINKLCLIQKSSAFDRAKVQTFLIKQTNAANYVLSKCLFPIFHI